MKGFFCSVGTDFIIKIKLIKNLFGNNKKKVSHLHRNKIIIQISFNLLH